MTVLPQGFWNSPHLFAQDLAQYLATCDLGESTLLQYMDDLLLCSPSLEASQTHTAQLHNFLRSRGYQVSPAKAQLTTPPVTYLDILLNPTSNSLTTDRIQALCDLQPPEITDYILSFLGLSVLFRHWTPNFAFLAKPLYQSAKETPHGPLTSPR